MCFTIVVFFLSLCDFQHSLGELHLHSHIVFILVVFLIPLTCFWSHSLDINNIILLYLILFPYYCTTYPQGDSHEWTWIPIYKRKKKSMPIRKGLFQKHYKGKFLIGSTISCRFYYSAQNNFHLCRLCENCHKTLRHIWMECKNHYRWITCREDHWNPRITGIERLFEGRFTVYPSWSDDWVEFNSLNVIYAS